MTKYVAQYGNSKRMYSIFLSTGFWITFVLSVVCGLVLIFGANYFALKTLKDTQYTPVFYVFGATIIFYALNELLLSVINGFREFKKYVTVNIAGSVVGLIFTVVAILHLRDLWCADRTGYLPVNSFYCHSFPDIKIVQVYLENVLWKVQQSRCAPFKQFFQDGDREPDRSSIGANDRENLSYRYEGSGPGRFVGKYEQDIKHLFNGNYHFA